MAAAPNSAPPPPESLDPEDWEAMRSHAHRVVDDAIDFLRTVRDRPVWRAVPDDVAATAFHRPLPPEPEGLTAPYDDFREHVLPYPMGNIHPRFWSWYMGCGTFSGALADFLAAVMNPNLGGGSHAAPLVEEQVVDWIREIAGYPEGAGGLLVSGGSMANLVGLAVARHAKAGFDIRAEGLRASPAPLVFYASTEVHSCQQKAVELMGMGSGSLRRVSVNDRCEIDLAALERTIADDRRAGLIPIGVIGSAGTVNTGAIDDLNALADLCERERLWFHVDGAIGALLGLSERHGRLIAGLERSDSVAFDLHKWMHVPFEAGCVLVRDRELHRHAFSLTPEYLQHADRGLAGGATWFSDYGFQLSRGFRALKVWMMLKEHGSRKFGRLIDRNIEQAAELVRLIENAPDLELMAPVPLNIVCFRFRPGGVDDPDLDALNRELLARLHESGIAAPSYTTLHGRFCLRAAIANHRTRDEDLHILIDAVRRIGAECARDRSP